MKVLFFGTPEVAVPYLKWLTEHQTVVGVVCQPDRPVGRGYKIVPPPVKEYALDVNLPVFQPAGPWTPDIVSQLKDLNAEVGIVVAYGRIMPEAVLSAPKLGCVNIHFSLLPKYRGAAPLQWALLNGETKTGVSAFWLVPEMDAGPIFHQTEVSIDEDDDAVSLRKKLNQAGVALLEPLFADLKANRLTKTPQQGAVVKAPLLKKEDGRIDWSKPASTVVNLVRGLVEWPQAFTSHTSSQGKKQLKVLKAKRFDARGRAGEIIEASHTNGIVVAAGDGAVQLIDVQPEGKKAMASWSFWQGAHLKVGDKLG